MGFRSKPLTPEEMKAKREKARARKSARALSRVRKLAAEAGDEALSEWEDEFLGSLETRLETYGAAFRDLEKGRSGDALSRLQEQKLKEIAAKARDAMAGDPLADDPSTDSTPPHDAPGENPAQTSKTRRLKKRARGESAGRTRTTVTAQSADPDLGAAPVEDAESKNPSVPGQAQRSPFRVIDGGKT